MNIDKTVTLYIPGGPWISGEYWDIFLESHDPIMETSVRYCLLNHEKKYSSEVSPSLDLQVNDLRDTIFSLSSLCKVNVVAHSYGAWLLMLAMNDKILGCVKRPVLIDMPFSLSRPDYFNKFLKQFDAFKPIDNESFTKYFTAILPLYFNKPSEYKLLFKKAYMEGNQGLLLKSMDIELISKRLREIQGLIFVNGANDQLLNDTEILHSSYVIENAGHFPMLEQTEKFSHLLSSILK